MKHITKISLTFIALTLAMSANAASGIDWTSLPWLGNGSGLPAYTNKYKVSPVVGMQVVNVQIPGFSSGAVGIYLTIGTQIDDCSVANNIQGGGILLHLSAFTAKETEVTINYHSGIESHKCTFWVYYADGSGDAGGSDVDEPETPLESNYCQKTLTGTVNSKQITMTCTKESEGNYKIVITGENLNGLGGSFVHINGTSPYNLGTNISSSSTTEIVCNIVSTTDPSFYTPLYVKYKEGSAQSQETFSTPSDIIWGVCGVELEPIYTEFSESICYGATYTWNEQTYSTGGDYEQTFEAVNGADSIVTLHLTVHEQTPATTEEVTIDYGETYTWNGNTYYASGEYTITLQDANGCDYQATLNLTVNPNPDAESGICTYTGVAGDGQTSGAGRQTFQSGYNIAMWLNTTKDSINIRLELLANDITGADNAYFHNYPTYSTITEIDQMGLTKESDGVFIGVIPISFISNNVDGIMRFGLKVAYPLGVIRVTTPEYFYLDGSGCAQRVFAIYHHDDLPAEPLEGEDQFTEFAGGKILQSIQYKRRMPSEVWETLSVPFDVDSVTAFDPATGEHVRLYAQYNNGSTQAGNYWLRYFKTPEVTRTDFQPNWYDIEATSQEAAKPAKDKAYIIRLPNGGGYYNDKYIVFHGRGYQEITEAYIAPNLPADDYYSYSGNNTMMPQYLSSAYVLDNAGYYFTSSSTVTLPPFECSVNATAATIAKMPRIALNGRNNTTTDLTLLPTTDLQGGVIYSIFGAAVARFNTIDEYDQACQTLAAGVYVIVTPSTTTKIQIP